MLILRAGIPGPIGTFPEILSQRISAGRFLVGRSDDAQVVRKTGWFQGEPCCYILQFAIYYLLSGSIIMLQDINVTSCWLDFSDHSCHYRNCDITCSSSMYGLLGEAAANIQGEPLVDQSGQNISHQNSQKKHWKNATEKSLDISSEHPLEKWQSFGKYHWQRPEPTLVLQGFISHLWGV